MNLIPCSICQRTFSEDVIDRHMSICQKNANKLRKTFNSEKQRKLADASVVPKKSHSKTQAQSATKKPNWKAKHEEFINTIRAARGVTKALKEGKELPPPPPPALNPDYVSCPYCERRFNETAAERHVKFCADQHKRLEVKMKMRTPVTSKLGETNNPGRKKYTPPPLKSTLVKQRTVPTKSFSATGKKQLTNTNKSPAYDSRRVGSMSAGSNKQRTGTSPAQRKLPDFVVDTSYNATGHGRTKTGLRPRVLVGDSTKQNEPARNEDHELYSPSFGSKTKPKSRKATNYSDLFGGDNEVNTKRFPSNHQSENETHLYSSNNRGKPKASRRTHDLPVAAVAPVKSDDEFTTSLFYEDYNYKPKYDESNSYGLKQSSFHKQQQPVGMSKFCHECGEKYPLATAKFCCNCGMKRI